MARAEEWRVTILNHLLNAEREEQVTQLRDCLQTADVKLTRVTDEAKRAAVITDALVARARKHSHEVCGVAVASGGEGEETARSEHGKKKRGD